jgi:hypothetical protein
MPLLLPVINAIAMIGPSRAMAAVKRRHYFS